jgi:hypothetical protein
MREIKKKVWGVGSSTIRVGDTSQFLVDNDRNPRKIKIASDTDGGVKEVLHRD